MGGGRENEVKEEKMKEGSETKEGPRELKSD